MRVFWPRNCLSNIPQGDKCIIVGWDNTPGDVVVVVALPYLEVDVAESLLETDTLFGSQRKLRKASQLYAELNHRRLSVVGLIGGKDTNTLFSGQVEQDGAVKLRGHDGTECLIIEYEPPNPARMHYLTLKSQPNFTGVRDSELHLRSCLDYHLPSKVVMDNWDLCIAQMNCVNDLQPLLRKNALDVFPEATSAAPQGLRSSGRTRLRSLSFNGPPVPSVPPRTKLWLLSGVMYVRWLVEWGLQMLEIPWVYGLSLTDLFCSAQQVDLRLNQLCYLPLQYIVIRKRQSDWHWMTPDRNWAYIHFNNYLWLWVNDWLLGFYLCTLIRANSDKVEQYFGSFVQKNLGTRFISLTQWLTLWPAGFKLNTQLARFMAELITWVIFFWRFAAERVLTPRITRGIVEVVAVSGLVGGATLQISLLIDIISISTFHLFIFYQALSRVYKHQLSVLGSLFRVFRGKKWNMLRHRVDAGDYDFQQLFLGTILFTVFLFLLPTVFAFYVVFALTRLAVIAAVAGLGIFLAFLNYFPLFPLLLRIKSPKRVPSGIRIEQMAQSIIALKSQPMRLQDIFAEYTDTMRLFISDSFSVEAVYGMFTGRLMGFKQAKLYASLYSVLPSHRGSVDVWYTAIKNYMEL